MAVSQTLALKEKGIKLVIFGEESQISSLTIGNWIAGNLLYFISKIKMAKWIKTRSW